MLAADAEAHDDEMILEGTGLLLLCFRAGGFLAASPGQQGGGAGGQIDEEGREHHGDDAQGQEGLVADVVEQTGGQTGGGQHEGEFTDLREAEGGLDGRTQRVALHQDGGHGQQALDQDEQQGVEQDGPDVLEEEGEIQHHAHGDEEQAHENVTVGHDARDDAHAVLGTGQHQACQKSAQRKGKAQAVGQQRHAETGAQGREEEQLARAGAHDRFHEAVEAQMRGQQHGPEDAAHLQHRQQHVQGRHMELPGQQGHTEHHGRDHDVLKNKDGQRKTPRRRAGEAFLLKNLQDDGRRGQGHETAPENTAGQACPVQKGGEAGYGQHRQADLQATPQEHGAFQTAQGLAGQFHTDGEQQHGHAQLRHIADGLAVHDAQQGRPAQYAGQQKSYGCRQLYLVAYKVDDDGKQENDDQFIEQFKMHLYLRGRCEPARHAPVPDRLGMPFAGELS